MKKISIIFILLFLTISFVGAATARKSDDKIYKMSEVDKKPEITEQPRVSADGKCGTAKSLTVRLRIVLRKSGKVTDVEILDPSVCEAFNERAVEASKAIKFKPAEKDGKPVSVAVTITRANEPLKPVSQPTLIGSDTSIASIPSLSIRDLNLEIASI